MRFELHLKAITAMHRPEEIRFAVHHRQSDVRPGGLSAATWKHGFSGNSVALQAVFPGLMAPPQQLVEVHHTCGIGVAKADVALEFKPMVGFGHGMLRWDGTVGARFSS